LSGRDFPFLHGGVAEGRWLFSARLFSRNLPGAWCDWQPSSFIAQAADDPGDHPKAEPLAPNFDHHLVGMPHRIGLSLEPSKVTRYGQSKLPAPASDGLVADVDSAFGEQILDVAQAQREPEIEPDGVLNYLRWRL